MYMRESCGLCFKTIFHLVFKEMFFKHDHARLSITIITTTIGIIISQFLKTFHLDLCVDLTFM